MAQSAKGEAMRAMIRSSFKANMHVTDPAQIAQLKMRAAVGIQNYVIHDSTRCAHSCPARSDVHADVRCGAQPRRQQAHTGAAHGGG